VSLLLEHGAEVDLRDATGMDALAMAQEAGHEVVAQLLQSRLAIKEVLRRNAAEVAGEL